MKISCPDEERLVDYFHGRLAEEDSSQLEVHLSECQVCLEALVVMKEMVGDMDRFKLQPVPNSVTEAAVDLVISQWAKSSGFVEKLGRSIKKTLSRMTETLRVPWGILQPVPIRGAKTVASEDFVRLTVSFKETKTEIEIEKAGEGKAHIRVKPDVATRHIKGIRVTLKKGEREVASYRLERAYVLFEDIPFGHYRISLAENGVELGTYLFEIKDTRQRGK